MIIIRQKSLYNVNFARVFFFFIYADKRLYLTRLEIRPRGDIRKETGVSADWILLLTDYITFEKLPPANLKLPRFFYYKPLASLILPPSTNLRV